MQKILISPWFLGALIVALALSMGILISLLQPSADSPEGFVLPPGDATRGRETFVQLECTRCHVVAGETFAAVNPVNPDLIVPLGGEVPRVKPYGEIVTSIIHPSETIRPEINAAYTDPNGNSLMPNYTAQITVRQLTDLVTFLREHYEVKIPEYPHSYYLY